MPIAMPPALNDQQDLLRQRAQALVDEHPHLMPRSAVEKPLLRWVAGNVKRLLRHRWPTVAFSTSCDRSSGGTWITVDYPRLPDAPALEDVARAIRPFQSKVYDSTTENETFDTDPEHGAFRRAFGSAGYVRATSHEPTPHEQRGYLQRELPGTARKPKPRM